MIGGDALFGLSCDKVLEYSLEKQKKYCVLLINYGHIDFAFDIYNANPNLQQYYGTLGRFFDHVNKNSSTTLKSTIIGKGSILPMDTNLRLNMKWSGEITEKRLNSDPTFLWHGQLSI